MPALQEYLKWFRFPTIGQAIRHVYLPTPDTTDHASKTTNDVAAVVSIMSEDEPEQQLALPPVLPMKAALYFDSADGFGEWRILISTRADRDLRQARRRDAKTFAIFVKKIKSVIAIHHTSVTLVSTDHVVRELSKGHFSDDNQKRLTGLDVEIPIYEAKMTGDTRLVVGLESYPNIAHTSYRHSIRWTASRNLRALCVHL